MHTIAALLLALAAPYTAGPKLASTTRYTLTESRPAHTSEVTDAAAVRDLLAAIGDAQVKPGTRRRCPDTVTVTFYAKDDKLGTLGFCATGGLDGKNPTEGAELTTKGAEGGLVALSNPARVAEVLKAHRTN